MFAFFFFFCHTRILWVLASAIAPQSCRTQILSCLHCGVSVLNLVCVKVFELMVLNWMLLFSIGVIKTVHVRYKCNTDTRTSTHLVVVWFELHRQSANNIFRCDWFSGFKWVNQAASIHSALSVHHEHTFNKTPYTHICIWLCLEDITNEQDTEYIEHKSSITSPHTHGTHLFAPVSPSSHITYRQTVVVVALSHWRCIYGNVREIAKPIKCLANTTSVAPPMVLNFA